ncbi:hypothetical protein C8R45DRAFT_848443 [Mycena sanguinolenta]|nr:hypothetical protein C8R45DRAFT_848443 [Mycena sanguinolenta]
MLLDIIDNLPRRRLSKSMLQMILWLLRELGVPHVPSFDQLRRIQQKTRQMSGNSVETRHVSTKGDVFYVNDIRESLSQHFANPLVAPHLHLYPERTDGYVAETWQAERWPEFGPEMLTPMYARGERHFYINEVAELDTGELVLPVEWFTVEIEAVSKFQIMARCLTEAFSQDGWRVNAQMRHKVLASRLKRNYTELDLKITVKTHDIFTDEPRTMPHPMRNLAGGDELYIVMANIWVDDVSGNRSKQYNKHLNVYFQNGCLPGRLNNQEYFVLFASTSPTVAWTDQLGAIRTQVQATEQEPVRTYNAHTNRPCRFIIRVPCEPADNPQQAEEASHLTGNALCKCRKCRAGGPAAETESDEGYHRLHVENTLRSVSEKKQELLAQLDAAVRNEKKEVERLQTATGTKDKITEFWIQQLLQKSGDAQAKDPERSEDSIAEELQQWLDSQPGDKMNPLLIRPGVDPTQDTPLEILHTILLGIVKYAWHALHTSMDDKQRNLFATRLYSTDISGLSIPPIRAAYIVQYRNNLIGKHFKSLMQTMPFHVHGLTDHARFKLVDAIGKLTARLWVHEIADIEQYCDDLDTLIGNVLDTFGDVEPAKIINKVKIHLLVHLPRDIRRFGPAIRFSTEIHESFNAIFRWCSIFSDRASPSRDIGRQLASMAWLKHVLSGGFWEDEQGKWVNASSEVRRVLQGKVAIQAHLGWAQRPKSTRPGLSILFHGNNILRLNGLRHSEAAGKDQGKERTRSLVETGKPSRSSLWFPAKSFIAQSGDDCRCNSWIVGQDDKVRPTFPVPLLYIVRIWPPHLNPFTRRVWRSKTNTVGRIGGSSFANTTALHLSLPSQKILFHFSVQHDCRLFKCDASDTRVVRQEHEDTSRTMPTVKHNDEDHFIINLYALHNADMIRQQLPRNLTEPIALYSDRKAHHKEIASTLRTNQVAKRKRTQERRKATRDMNIRLGLTKSAKKGTKRKRNQGQSAEEDPEETTPAGGHDSEVEEEGAEEPTARRRNVTRRAHGRGQRNAVDGIDDGEMDDDADSAVGEAAGENESDGGNSDDEGNRGDSDYEPDERDAEPSPKAGRPDKAV